MNIANFLRTTISNNLCERLVLVVAASFSMHLSSRITLTGCFFLFNEKFPFNFSNSSQISYLALNSKYSEMASCHIKLGRRKQIQFNQTKSKHLPKKFFCIILQLSRTKLSCNNLGNESC